MYTFLLVFFIVSHMKNAKVEDQLTSTNIRGPGLLDLPNLVTKRSHRQEKWTRS